MAETRRLLDSAVALSALLTVNNIPHAFYGSVLSATLANSMYTNVSLSSTTTPISPSTSLSPGNILHSRRRSEQTSPLPTGQRRCLRKGRLVEYSLPVDKQVTSLMFPYPCSMTTTERLHVTYRAFIPPIEVRTHIPLSTLLIIPIQIEILPAGETGPRHLDDTNVMTIQGIPFLNISEFVRAKLKTWMMCVLPSYFPNTHLTRCIRRGAEGDAHDIIYILTRFWNRVDINRIPEQDMNHFVSRNNTAAAAWSALRRKYGM